MSRFVSGGTNDEPTERDEEWRRAQQEIEAKRQEKAELGKQDGGKSLYETLQANKAAKQEQFEESIRLKNQFRSLDEDEVDFLDSVLESTRAKEAEVKKETREQLEAFRRQQEEAEKATRTAEAAEPNETTDTTSWTVGPRKKRKAKEDLLAGVVKLKKASSIEKRPDSAERSADSSPPATIASIASEPAAVKTSIEQARTPISPTTVQPSRGSASPPVGLGLGAYSSDEDD